MGVNVEMKYHVCYSCAGTYAYPSNYGRVFCPFCMDRRYTETIDEKWMLERRIIALKGVITKLKKSNRKTKED
jgi:uncharacterized Zn finger protein (UPF0148 family)